jgi:hypothetical protein
VSAPRGFGLAPADYSHVPVANYLPDPHSGLTMEVDRALA